MKVRKPFNFMVVIIAAIVSSGLYKQFDSTNQTFEKPALAAIYGIVLLGCIYIIVRDFRNQSKTHE